MIKEKRRRNDGDINYQSAHKTNTKFVPHPSRKKIEQFFMKSSRLLKEDISTQRWDNISLNASLTCMFHIS